LTWYEGGHWPPPSAIDGAAEWMAEQLRTLGAGGKRSRQAG
jgi:hypothetical protein